MAATIGFLAVLGTATAEIPATNDYVIQLRSSTAGEVGNMTKSDAELPVRAYGVLVMPI